MANKKTVQIPVDLFNDLIYIFEYIDISSYDPEFRRLYHAARDGLQEKKRRIERREEYSRLVAANKTGDEDEQHEARIDYLRSKSNLP